MRRWRVAWAVGCLVAGLVATLATASVSAQEGAQGRAAGRPDRGHRARLSLARARDHLSGAAGAAAAARDGGRAGAPERSADRQADVLFRHAATPIGGNPDGDVTLVEFFDYRCGYCRRVVRLGAARWSSEDQDLRVVFKEFPILGRGFGARPRARRSRPSARDSYMPFHFALMAADDLSHGRHHAGAAGRSGSIPSSWRATWSRPAIEAAAQGQLRARADALGIEGTPAFVIGEDLMPGAVDRAPPARGWSTRRAPAASTC